MRPAFRSVSVCLLLVACAPHDNEPPARPESAPASEPAVPAAAEAPVDERHAYFAGGCFWGVEHYLEQLDGVLDVESGYMGGHVKDPSYEQVVSQTSGHFETVDVRYDANRVSYREVATLFFEIHDPTQANGQGPDIGSSYRSVVFYADDEQKEITEQLIARLAERGYAVVTEVRPAAEFYRAEDYHQDYYERTGKTPYCHGRVRRFGD